MNEGKKLIHEKECCECFRKEEQVAFDSIFFYMEKERKKDYWNFNCVVDWDFDTEREKDQRLQVGNALLVCFNDEKEELGKPIRFSGHQRVQSKK